MLSGISGCSKPARSNYEPLQIINMKIQEYQAKELLKEYNVPVPAGVSATTVDQAVETAREMKEDGTSLFVVKAQIHAGGRGKGETKNSVASGVSLCVSLEEMRASDVTLLGDDR